MSDACSDVEMDRRWFKAGIMPRTKDSRPYMIRCFIQCLFFRMLWMFSLMCGSDISGDMEFYRVFGRVFCWGGWWGVLCGVWFCFCMLIDLSGTSLKCLPGGLWVAIL